MTVRVYTREDGPICPKCKLTAIKLVSLTDDGKGKRMCVSCKKKTKLL